MSSTQMALPGLEALCRPVYEWQPLPHILAKIRNYFTGYVVNGKPIKKRVKGIAEKLGLGVRTLFRYLAHLRETGELQTMKRRPRHVVRNFTRNQQVTQPAGTSRGTCIEVNSEVRTFDVSSGMAPAAPSLPPSDDDPNIPPERFDPWTLKRILRESPSPVTIMVDIGRRFAASRKRRTYEEDLEKMGRELAAEMGLEY